MRNQNEMVSFYPCADGVKIGWTPGAGNTIVASATRNGHRVIVALLRTPNRAAESAALLDWAFASFAWP
jgi:D-alanyl-D-alanine carboxypeptidase (penicillin-binding protein 5/6)